MGDALVGGVQLGEVREQLGIEALEAGKHVVVEKPMDVTVEAAQRLALHGDAGSIVIEGDRITVDARRGESPEPMARPGEDALRVAGTGSRAVSTAEQVATGSGGPGAVAAAGASVSAPVDPTAPGETAEGEPGDPGEPEVWGAAHRRQLADVARAVALGREPAVTAADGLRAVELVTAVYRSAATGQGVRLG